MSRQPGEPLRFLVAACVIALAGIPVRVAAQSSATEQVAPQLTEVLVEARRLAASGQRPEAISLLQQHLGTRPDDVDARTLLGIIRSWDGQYAEARTQLRIVLDSNPGFYDAVAAMANIELWDGNAEVALSFARSVLKRNPKDAGIAMTKARAEILLGRVRDARDTLERLLAVEPDYQAAIELRARLADNSRVWSVGYGYGGDWFSDRRTPWQEQFAVLKRQAGFGSVTLTWSQASRYGLKDQQYEIELYPRLRRGTYMYLDAGGADDADLYPTYRAGALIYQSLGRGFEASAGMSRLGFGRGLNIYIASVSKSIGNWFVISQVFVTPHDLGTKASYHLAVRRYLSDKEYLGVRVHRGAARENIRTVHDLLALNAAGVSGEMVVLLGSHVAFTCRGAFESQQRASLSPLRHTLRLRGLMYVSEVPMIERRAAFGFLLLRLIFSIFCFITSLYCLVAFIPFTYQQVIEFQVVSWTGVFASYHPWFYWLAFASVAWTLRKDYRPGTRGLVAALLAAGSVAGIALVASPVLPGLGNDPASLAWAAVWLLPLGAVAIVDLAGAGRRIVWARADAGENGRLLRACVATALAVAVLYAAMQPVRPRGIVLDLASAGILAWSVVLHLVVFTAFYLGLAVIRFVASRGRRPALVEFALTSVSGIVVLIAIVDMLIFASVSMVDATGHALAAWFGIALGLAFTGWAVRLAPDGVPVTSGIGLAFRPMTALAGTSAAARMVMLAVWVGGAYWLAVATSVMDWNYLFQTLSAIAVWTVGWAWIYDASRRPTRAHTTTPRQALTGCAAGVALAAVLGFAAASLAPASMTLLHLPAGTNSAAVDRYAAYDVSFRMVHDLTEIDRMQRGSEMDAFYALLRRHTNIPRTVTITTPDVSLVQALHPPFGRAPHVFFFTIDSLRPDYLSPYNSAVTFTPAMARFAAESTVFLNAFTRYGATGLSEPALWTGMAVPHQQYPDQYWRMNSLQKLMQAGQYQAFVSKDHILQRLLAPWPGLTELDRGLNARDYDACRTLAELGQRVAARNRDDARPLFAYTQPQNVHIAAITREGATVPAGESYPGFYAPYAARVHRLDACFGTFLETLRREQLYDDSVIILTADHGESMGEDGRWGHAYTLYPEVLKIPMIVHLPVWMRGVAADPRLIAFTVDLTPTLYYLLGQKPILDNPLFGRPLFTERPEEATPYLRSHYVVASSYGPVYAVISDAGRSLYIADGVSNREYAFDMTTGPGGMSRGVTDADRASGVKAIRDMLRDLGRFSGVPLQTQ